MAWDNATHLENLSKLSRSNVRIDIKDLTLGVLGKTSQNGKTASADGSLDRRLVDAGDFTHKTVLVLVEVLGGKDAGGDGTSAGAETFESGGKLEILLQKDTTGNVKSLGVGDSDTIFVVGDDTFRFEKLVTGC